MAIDKIGSIGGMNEYSKIGSTSRMQKSTASDSVKISGEASALSETKRVFDMVNEAPDVRADKVAALKAMINDPAYITEKMVGDVADKLLKNI